MKGKDFLSIEDITEEEFFKILDKAGDIKVNPRKYRTALEGKTLAMIFEKPSLRTRVTFETGMTQMGGHAIYLSRVDFKLGERESIPDVARNLERWVDIIMARTFANEAVCELAKYASVPVINGLTDLLHPCQAVTDYFTVREIFGGFKNKKLAYIGDGNNIAHSLLYGASKVGMNISIVTPEGYEPKREIVDRAKGDSGSKGIEISVVHDPKEGLKGADVVYTDVWASMGQEDEALTRKKIFKDYQVNRKVMSLANKGAIFMHLLPAHRGEEVTDDVADSDQSVIFQQAENRLHVQKAIMLLLVGS